MEIQRTANAGVLLKLDGVSILLDGLCDRVEGYLPTPAAIANRLLTEQPDILAFTHGHSDHCSKALLLPYAQQNLRPILGPESLPMERFTISNVVITPVQSRHLGKAEPGLQHVSYIIQGSSCVWFMGDAAPMQWRNRTDLPRPDLIIAPYAYANTSAAWNFTCSLTDKVILLHLPEKERDCYGLWQTVAEVTADTPNVQLWIPEIGQSVFL